jgi:hypothetical protein
MQRSAQLMLWSAAALLTFLACGCATAPLDRAGSLRSYNNLKRSDGVLTRTLLNVHKDDVLAAKTVAIVPTTFSMFAPTPFTEEQRNLVTNAVDRTLCAGLSERFEVVGPSQSADLTVHAIVTHVDPTDPIAVGFSKGASVAKSVLLPGVPVPVPRIPIGLGSLSLEAEARDPLGNQKAAMIWGRGANAFMGSGRVAQEADAYSLAADFGGDFSILLVKGATPFGAPPSPPSFDRVRAHLGGAHKFPACESFGRLPGLVGMMGDSLGLPPKWTDKGAASGRE